MVYQRLQLLKMKPQPSTTQASKIYTKPQCASCAVACDPWLPREIARSIPLEVQVVWQVLRYSLAEPKRMSWRLERQKKQYLIILTTILKHGSCRDFPVPNYQVDWSFIPLILGYHPEKITPWSPDPLDDSHSLTWKDLANLQNFLIGIGVPASTNIFAAKWQNICMPLGKIWKYA